MENKFQRQTAIKTNIKNITFGKFIKTSEQEANYHLGINNDKLYRVNLTAIIVQKEQISSITNLMLDDGSGKITLRSFEKNKGVDNSNVGETIMVIGKVRSYNEEIYLSPEIVKKINPLWLKLRSIELKNKINLNPSNEDLKENIEETEKKSTNDKNLISNENNDEYLNEIKELKDISIEENHSEIKNDIIDTENNEIQEDHLLPVQKIIEIIKEMDNGEGVMIEEIIEKSTLDNSEKVIEKMLEAGDIFQIQPGKVKIL